MLDIKLLREKPDLVKKDLEKRFLKNLIPNVDKFAALDKEWRELKRKLDSLRHKGNLLSGEINKLKKENKPVENKLVEAKKNLVGIKSIEESIKKHRGGLDELLKALPNLTHKSVPVGKEEGQNKVIRVMRKKPKFSFTPRDHVDLISSLGLADIERASKVSGARFYYLKDELVLLELALERFALDLLNKKGYTLVRTPDMIKREAIEGAAELPDFEETLYKIDGEDLFLISTAEQSLASLHMGEIMNMRDLPLKYAGISSCYRKEAGSHGKDTKGIFRVHEFRKVEQFVYCRPEESWQLHEELLKNAEELFKKLKIPYRVVNIVSGCLNATAAKKYDIEAWLPAQKKYREVVSCSNCTDYQARKLNIKFRDGNEFRYVHLLNATAVATTRAIVAIIENYQQRDGSVKIPNILQPYMGGLKKIVQKSF